MSVTIDDFIEHWRHTGGSELANTQSFINGLCSILSLEAPHGSRTDDAHNDYVFERRVFQDNGDGTTSFGRIDAYKRGHFILEAKQGSEADRASEAAGNADLDFFGQTATQRVKRGTARRGTPGWAKAMVQAKGQAERYAKALPVDHSWPPFLLITDVGYCIDVYADFNGTGRAYAQFPDRSSFRIMLDDLRNDDVQKRLRAIWTEPKSLDPDAVAAKVTRVIADLLATLARRLEARGHGAERVSAFLSRLLFTMFAEDTGLIPEGSFSQLLLSCRPDPSLLAEQLPHLWTAMDRGEFSPALAAKLRRFNGYLFKEHEAIDVDAQELEVLIEAAAAKWTEVEPAIFGTLLERALNPKERATLGAHYTPRAYVERLVMPTVIEPLRGDWNGVRAAVASLIDEGKADQALRTVEAFHGQLARTKVLDPACGTGNFLYVAMARMKELEGEVVELLEELGDRQYLAELSGHTITPENFLGIEINPRAAAIAQLVLWIGYLQWHFKVAGKDRMPAEPILKDIRTIENRDALIEWDDRVVERDQAGDPLTRWDGETMKIHPVTGATVPNEAARVEVYRYVNPRPAQWPAAHFIVGNPPFIGSKRMRSALGDSYVDAVQKAHPRVPDATDLVLRWWHVAARLVQLGQVRRAGLICTNSINQTFNRRIISEVLAAGDTHLTFAIGDHPWTDAKDGAAVRISMIVLAPGRREGRLIPLVTAAEDELPEAAVGHIGADFRVGADLTSATPLQANANLCCVGMKSIGAAFVISEERRTKLLAADGPALEPHIRQFVNGRDLTERPRGVFIIDLYGLSEAEVQERFPTTYQYLLTSAKPEREQNRNALFRRLWWVIGHPRPLFRDYVASLGRYIVTLETAKHRVFTTLNVATVPDSALVTFGFEDGYTLGVLSSRIHVAWALLSGGRLGVGNDPRYNKTRCFDPFPFPPDPAASLKDRICAEAEALDALRKGVLAEHQDLTLTGLYNVLEALRVRRALTPKEREVHDRGLVSVIRQHHDAIDGLVAEAYGWPAGLSDEGILTRLVALNKERVAEEAKGLVRWLRPEFQAPDAQVVAIDGKLDLGEAASAPVSGVVIPWPKSLPDQVSAVAGVLTSASGPLSAQEVARTFGAKRAASITPVLDALAAIGQARRLSNGRYAA